MIADANSFQGGFEGDFLGGGRGRVGGGGSGGWRWSGAEGEGAAEHFWDFGGDGPPEFSLVWNNL